MSDAVDALETAANVGKEAERLACHKALYRAAEEREDAFIDLEEAVRGALYGSDEDAEEG